MKKSVLFTLLTALFVLKIKAQQNVGIGTTTPVFKLHVQAGNDSLVSFENTLTLATGIRSGLNFKTGAYYTGAVRTTGLNTSSARLGFFAGPSILAMSIPERMSILSDGKVGIGTTAPIAKLHIDGILNDPIIPGTSTAASFRLGFGSNMALDFGKASGVTGAAWLQAGAIGVGHPLALQPIDGNIGIGTMNPTTKVQIGDYNTNPHDTYLTLKTVGGALYKSGVGLYHADDTNGWLLESDETQNRFSIRHRNGSVFNNPVFNIDGSDRVGIGTVNPTTRLQVGDYTNNPNDTYISIKTSGGTYKSGLSFYHANDNFGWLLESDQNSQTFSIRHRSSIVFNNPVFTINPQDNVGINQVPNTDSRLAITSGNNSYGLYVNGSQAQTAALNVNGKSIFSNNVGIGSTVFGNTRLNVAAGAGNAFGLYVDGNGAINTALSVNAGTTTQYGLYVNGTEANIAGLAATGQSSFFVGSRQVTVNGTASGGATNEFASYPLLVEGGQQGIAVHINSAAAHAGNNYMYFADNSYVRGSIAGQNLDELRSSFEYQWFSSMSALEEAFIGAEGLVCAAQVDLGEVGVMAANVILVVAKWAEEFNNMESSVGVVYQSAAADYAEWLERADVNEKLEPGMIVGVTGGRVSRTTAGSRQLMVISTAPLVLGNTPQEGRASAFEKVAFMGQVPVRVRGKVDIGDYVLASGDNDGVGIAIAPAKMQLEDYDKVVGVAWSSSIFSGGESLIKTAVGLNTHDLIGEIKQQKTEVTQLKETLQGVMAYLKEKDPAFKLNMPASQGAFASSPGKSLPFQSQVTQPKKPASTTNLIQIHELLKNDIDYVDKMLQGAKDLCISRGMNVNSESMKKFFDREEFFQRLEKAISHKVTSNKTKMPVIGEASLKPVEPMSEKK